MDINCLGIEEVDTVDFARCDYSQHLKNVMIRRLWRFCMTSRGTKVIKDLSYQRSSAEASAKSCSSVPHLH